MQRDDFDGPKEHALRWILFPGKPSAQIYDGYRKMRRELLYSSQDQASPMRAAYDGRGALRSVAAHPPDLIIRPMCAPAQRQMSASVQNAE